MVNDNNSTSFVFRFENKLLTYEFKCEYKPVMEPNKTNTAKEIGISLSHLSNIISKRRNAPYSLAKRMVKIIGGDVEIWCEGPEELRKQVFEQYIEKGTP